MKPWMFLPLLPVALGACTGPMAVEALTPASITTCYDTLLIREQVVADAALQHCRAVGLVPRVSMRSRCGFAGSLERVTYDCVPLPRPADDASRRGN